MYPFPDLTAIWCNMDLQESYYPPPLSMRRR